MFSRIARLAVVAALLPALGGCALLGLGRNEARVTAQSTLPMGAEAFVRFEEGRAALDSGQNAAAIAAFSEARMEPSLLASSLNGMGVAYARLGRIDLAERYFMQAASTAPDDRRFAANLAQAQGALLAARHRLMAPPPAMVASVAQPRTIRAGAGVVHLQSQGQEQAHITVAEPHQRFARINPAQIELSSAVAPSPRTGARVRLAEAPRQRQSYPIRIALAD